MSWSCPYCVHCRASGQSWNRWVFFLRNMLPSGRRHKLGEIGSLEYSSHTKSCRDMPLSCYIVPAWRHASRCRKATYAAVYPTTRPWSLLILYGFIGRSRVAVKLHWTHPWICFTRSVSTPGSGVGVGAALQACLLQADKHGACRKKSVSGEAIRCGPLQSASKLLRSV